VEGVSSDGMICQVGIIQENVINTLQRGQDGKLSARDAVVQVEFPPP